MKSQRKKNSDEKTHSQVGVRIRHSCAIEKLRVINDSLTHEQRKMIEKTPFHVLLDVPNTEINGYLLSALIEGWDEGVNGFWIKGKLVRFTLHDVACILGLRVGGTAVRVFDEYGSSQLHDLLRASFPGQPLTRALVQNLIKKCEGIASLEDFCRVYIAFAFTTFLFPLPSRGIHGNFFSLLDNLDDLGEYGWGKAVYDFLVDGICHAVKTRKREKNSSEIRIKGCAPLLQLWALEHTLMVKPGTSKCLWPRIRNWTSKTLTNNDAHAMIYSIEGDKKVVNVLAPSKQELKEVIIIESMHDADYLSLCTPVSSNHVNVKALPDSKSKYEEKCVKYQNLLQEHDQLRNEHESLKGTLVLCQVMYEKKCGEYDQLLQAYEGLMKGKHTGGTRKRKKKRII